MSTVLISGASRGIGLELTKQYAADGDTVIACCRNPDTAELLQDVEAANANVRVVKMDVADIDSIKAAATELAGTAIDILINNAGVTGGNHQSLGDINYAEWVETFRVNTFAPLQVAEAFHDHLKLSDNPKVMTVTSQLGASTWPMGGMYAYSTSKAAVNKVVQILAKDWKDEGITVAVVHPGWVQTDMGGPQAEITPEESASGIRSVIDGLSADNSGAFYKWNGEFHPW